MQYLHIFSFLNAHKEHDNVRDIMYEMTKIEFKEKKIIYLSRRIEKLFNRSSLHIFFFFNQDIRNRQ